jgi:hypothetical protein
MPENAIYVGRPTPLGNPRKASNERGRTVIINMYRQWLSDIIENYPIAGEPARKMLRRIRGFDLACWCPLNQPCHADILLEIANQ